MADNNPVRIVPPHLAMTNVTYSRIKMEADAVLENGLELKKKVSTVSNKLQMDRRANLNIFQASNQNRAYFCQVAREGRVDQLAALNMETIEINRDNTSK